MLNLILQVLNPLDSHTVGVAIFVESNFREFRGYFIDH